MALPRLKSVVYLTSEQYNTLKETGTLTVGGVTYTFDENTFYATSISSTAPISNDYNDLDNKPQIDTTSTQALTPQANETLAGIKKLHKISKTGTSTDLVDSNTIIRTGDTSSTPVANKVVKYDSSGYLISNVIEGADGDNLISIMNSNIIVGEMTEQLLLQGSLTRPKYNNVDLALLSDIPSFGIRNTTNGVANSVVLDWTNNILSAQLNEDITATLQKVLVVPMTRPTTTELVAVDNTGGQTMVDIGANLLLTGDTLSADLSSCAKNSDFSKDTVTQFGSNAIIKRVSLWKSSSDSGSRINDNSTITITFNQELEVGDIVEVVMGSNQSGSSARRIYRFRYDYKGVARQNDGNFLSLDPIEVPLRFRLMNFTFNGTGTGATVGIDCFTLNLSTGGATNNDGGYGFIYEVAKIIQ